MGKIRELRERLINNFSSWGKAKGASKNAYRESSNRF